MMERTFLAPSFSLRNRLGRLLWGWAYALLIWPSPRVCHGWRAFWLRCFGARLGRRCRIYPRAQIWAPWNLECGDEVIVADTAVVDNKTRITLGRRTVVSQQAYLAAGSHDLSDLDFRLVAAPIETGENVWIAAGAMVLPGVTLGQGAVAAARAVVTRDVPPWTVVAGNPARKIKERTWT
ncbi:MAG: putative colanic acid biosynthesis acetyltransferase WcaF [Puniceicoccaceae bacterium 5H]|nr:MAG: putative colanic acid biosynthesis acetyltransferase WcaF [Puniceicoccaceae bacterium 5H]